MTDGEIRAAMHAKVGASAQRPPASPRREGGRTQLYDAAREGEPLDAPARIVRVNSGFEMTERDGATSPLPAASSGGTYVRCSPPTSVRRSRAARI